MGSEQQFLTPLWQTPVALVAPVAPPEIPYEIIQLDPTPKWISFGLIWMELN